MISPKNSKTVCGFIEGQGFFWNPKAASTLWPADRVRCAEHERMHLAVMKDLDPEIRERSREEIDRFEKGEIDFWSFTEPYGWGTKTTDFKEIKKDLMRRLTAEQAHAFRKSFEEYRGALYKACFHTVEGCGDDSFSDLISHIVGLGRKEYEATLANPRLAQNRCRENKYTESFAYAIPSKDSYEDITIEHYLKWAADIIEVYGKILDASEDDIPWLPKLRDDLDFVSCKCKAFIVTKDPKFMLEEGLAVAATAEKVAEYMNRLNRSWFPEKGTLAHAVGQAGNKYFVWNLLTDLRDYREFLEPVHES